MTVSLHITKLLRLNQCQDTTLDLVSFCSLAHWFNIYEPVTENVTVYFSLSTGGDTALWCTCVAPGNYFQSLLPRKSEILDFLPGTYLRVSHLKQKNLLFQFDRASPVKRPFSNPGHPHQERMKLENQQPTEGKLLSFI